MPSFLASAIEIQEEEPQIRSAVFIPTALPAFLGVTERGPIADPQFITSFDEYVKTFGGLDANSDLSLAMRGFYQNGGTGAWVGRTLHYTDITNAGTATGVKATKNILDRGGAASAAVLNSVAETFDLEPGEQLDVNLDSAGTDSLVFSATAAQASGGTETYALSNGQTLIYRVKLPGSASFTELRTITFVTGDFVAIGAATAQEVVNVVNRDGLGIFAELIAGPSFRINSDKRGTAADLDIDATSTALTALGLSSGVTSGGGNVADIDAVTASEVASLLTALPLSSGTATASAGVVTLTSTGTGAGVTVVVEATTTALGIFSGALPITANGSAAGTSNTLQVDGKTEGTYGNDVKVIVAAATSGDSDEFDLSVEEDGVVKEIFPNLSMTDTDANYVEDVVNNVDTGSNLIAVTDLDSPASSPNDLPALGTHSLAGGDDGLTSLDDNDFVGDSAAKTGLNMFDDVQDLTLLAVPGRATSAVHNAMVTYAEVTKAGSMFAVLDPPTGNTASQIVTYVTTTASLLELSEYAAIFWPRVKILNPNKTIFGSADQIVAPPSGHILGTFARVDSTFTGGVYRAAAGIEAGRLFNVLGFETDEVLDKGKRDLVYPKRINPLSSFPGAPRFIDGVRTLKGTGNFPSIPERRGVIFIEQTIIRTLEGFRFAPNDEETRNAVERTIFAFLLTQLRSRAFRSLDPSKAFFVDADVAGETINPASEQFAGRLNVRIGLATNKPAEFIVLRFSQDVRALDEEIQTAQSGR